MYFNEGKCAQCNRQLPPTYKSTPINREISIYWGSYKDRPYFCNESCWNKAINLDQIEADFKTFNDQIETEITWEATQADHLERYSPEGIEVVERLERKIVERRAQAKKEYGWHYKDAADEVFKTYSEGVWEEKAKVSSQQARDRTVIPPDTPRIQEVKISPHRLAFLYECPPLAPMFLKLAEEVSGATSSDDIVYMYSEDSGVRTFESAFRSLLDRLKPVLAAEGDEFTEIAVIDLLHDPLVVIELYLSLFDTPDRRRRIRRFLGIAEDALVTPDEERRRLFASKITPRQILDVAFAFSTVRRLFAVTIPIRIPETVRFAHTHILGGTGSGKTTAMETMLLNDFRNSTNPAIIVIDPKGEMTRRLQTLAIFEPGKGSLSDFLVILDATQPVLPALNFFAHADPDLDPIIRQRIENQQIGLLDYIFGSSDFKLTAKQSVGFGFLARLMFKIPNADLMTFMDVIEEEVDYKKGQTSRYLPYIQQLDLGSQRFFGRDFYDEFKETKAQIKSRLYMILASPALASIFNTPVSAIDWFDVVQNGRIVLVNSGFNEIGEDASQVFGRYVIASVVAAVGARSAVPRNLWRPAYLYIDEAQLYVDDTKTQMMLSLMREYKLGIILAHQQMTGQPLTDNIRNSISTNTSIKLAATVGPGDISNAAKDLRTDPDFINSHATTKTHVHFACYVRNTFLKQPFTYIAEINKVGREPQMSAAAERLLLINNQKLVGGVQSVAPAPTPTLSTQANVPLKNSTPPPEPSTFKLLRFKRSLCELMIKEGMADETGFSEDRTIRWVVIGTDPAIHERILSAPLIDAVANSPPKAATPPPMPVVLHVGSSSPPTLAKPLKLIIYKSAKPVQIPPTPGDDPDDL